MDEETLGPSPKQIMALGAMVERTLACKCESDEVDDSDIEVQKSQGYGRGLYWHKTNISWDDATLETTGLTDFDHSMVQIDITTVRSESILSNGNEDDDLDEILDKFVPESKKAPFKFLSGKKKTTTIAEESVSSVEAIQPTVTAVEGDESQSGFEVEFRYFEI